MVLLTIADWDHQHPLMGSPGELGRELALQHFDLGEVEAAEVPITEGSVQPSEVPRESPGGAGTSDTSPGGFLGGSWRVTCVNGDSEPLPSVGLPLFWLWATAAVPQLCFLV